MTHEDHIISEVVIDDLRRFTPIRWSLGNHQVVIKPTENTIEYIIEGDLHDTR